MKKLENVLTIDVEDYFQVAALAESIETNKWDSIPTRVEANTDKILAIFNDNAVKGTFFTLGWVAERYPGIVKKIQAEGHEIASHGYSHQLIYDQDIEVFRQETIKSKQILEDITGEAVLGYRAASYSITNRSLWALDILAEAGFKYDSSIFPVRHDRYGIADSPKEPYLLTTDKQNTIVEYPLTTYSFLGQSIPVAGGGYFRLYPYWLSKFFYNAINKNNKAFAFYLHPWEVDPNQPKVKASWFSEFRHYNNLDKCESRLDRLLKDFDFITMKEKLSSLKLI
jgi:polysaccharide deacetylase family protein (PEP-CTERM system associated)